MPTHYLRAAIATIAAAILIAPHAPAPALRAQSATGIDAALLAGLRWRSIGPARGGRSHRGGWQQQPSERVLLRRNRRGSVEDH